MGARITVVAAGAVGGRAARQLLSSDGVDAVTLAAPESGRRAVVARSLGPNVEVSEWSGALARRSDAVVIAAPGRHHARIARQALEADAHVISTADAVPAVRGLLELDGLARERERHLVVGAGFAPGLTCVLARHGASDLETVEEIHVARLGTGGPECARQHHRALAGEAFDWRDGSWIERRSGSGRELCWFPDPVGGKDCYRAELPDPLLIVPAFPGIKRVTARQAASRRDRLTSRLPMLRPPHPEGTIGAVRVEIRGRRGAMSDVRVLGAIDRPAVGAGIIAAVASLWACDGKFATVGAGGLAQLLSETVPFLAELSHRGVKAAVFEGAPA